jgi:hypothetical protein
MRTIVDNESDFVSLPRVISAAPFCSGRPPFRWPTVTVRSIAGALSAWRRIATALIERTLANHVQMMMGRARAIFVSLMPALVLLASVDCIGGSFAGGGRSALGCLVSADGCSKQNRPPSDTSFDQVVQRWTRRLNPQSGSDGFAPPAALPSVQPFLPDPAAAWFDLPSANHELARSWQFHWRTASEPRAPSAVS